MKKLSFLCLGLMTVALALPAPRAFAGGMALDAGKVEKFITTMAPVNALGAEMKKQGRDPAAEGKGPVNESGQFAPYSSSVTMLKEKFAGDYGRLADIVKKHGFSSVDEWAGVGDAVMLSYVAIKTEQANPGYADMQTKMTPEMMAQVPPEAKAQIEASMKMMSALKNAPAADKAVVSGMMPKIEQAMGLPAEAPAEAPKAGSLAPATP